MYFQRFKRRGKFFNLSFIYSYTFQFTKLHFQVCAVEPLSFGQMEHPLKNFCIAALATLSKFVIVTIRPRLKVIKFHPMTGPADCLPLLAWQMVLIQSADTTRVIDPVLAAVRGNNLYFHQVKLYTSLL